MQKQQCVKLSESDGQAKKKEEIYRIEIKNEKRSNNLFRQVNKTIGS